MKNSFLKNPTYTIFFGILNAVINSVFIYAAIYSFNISGEFQFNFSWMILFTAVFFFIIFNAHFVFLGAFARIHIKDSSIQVKRLFKTDITINLENVVSISRSIEIRHFIKTVEAEIFVVEGFDEISKNTVAIKIDYRAKVYDMVVDAVNAAHKKTIKKMHKYFDKHPK